MSPEAVIERISAANVLSGMVIAQYRCNIAAAQNPFFSASLLAVLPPRNLVNTRHAICVKYVIGI